ncbi:hypothetical protein Tco_1580838 [Tanacetum coccineum]
MNLMMKLVRSDDKFSQMLTQYESTPELGSRSGGWVDDEMADDEDGGKDKEDKEDGDRKSPGKVSLASFPIQCIPGNMSPEIGIPSDKSPGKAWNCRWG